MEDILTDPLACSADMHEHSSKCMPTVSSGTPPTWSKMVATLQDPTIGEGELAKELESKFVHPNSKDTTDTGPAPKRRDEHSGDTTDIGPAAKRRGEHSLMHGDNITECKCH